MKSERGVGHPTFGLRWFSFRASLVKGRAAAPSLRDPYDHSLARLILRSY